MFFFNKKTPEEKEAARIAKLRKAEGDRGFGGALMTPVGELALADICLTRLHPETQTLVVHCQKREFSIPYANLRGLICSSEAEIALIEGDAGQFVGPLDAKATHRARWFLRLDYVDETGAPQGLTFIAYNMRGFYIANNKLYAAVQFEESMQDIVSRYANSQEG